LTPARFWNNYEIKYIQTKESNQSLWGGYRKNVWYNDEINTFDKENILNYATHNGWHLTNSLNYINGTLNLQTNYDESDYSYAFLQDKVIPFLKPNEIYEIFVFTTGWIAVEPGNIRETEKNGFVIFNSDKKDLLIYHLWGE
jgi:hypothetical protein